MKLTATFLLSISLVWASYLEPNPQADSEGLASVSVRMTFKYPGFLGYGGYLGLVNVESGKVYESTSRMGLRPYILVEDLPIGKYEVVYLNVMTGGPYIFLDNQELFNRIVITESKNYYLGNYLIKKIKPTFKLHVSISKQEDEIDEKIYKKIGKINKKWTSLEMDFSQCLFEKDSTKVVIID